MDRSTIEYYNQNARELFHRYSNANTGMSTYFTRAFPVKKSKILDIGCGSGRDMMILSELGYIVNGVDASWEMLTMIAEHYPRFKDRLMHLALPELAELKGLFEGILCSAVLMHIAANQLTTASQRIYELLVPRGRLLISLPHHRPEVDPISHRDGDNRLFTSVNSILDHFQTSDWQLLQHWQDEDSLGRKLRWLTLLYEKIGES